MDNSHDGVEGGHVIQKRSARQTVRDYIDRMRARRRRGKVIPPVTSADGTHDPYPVTYPYGVRNPSYAAGFHTGEDHACPTGSRCQATSYGKVVALNSWGSAYGNHVVVRTGDNKYDYGFCHLSHIGVEIGDNLKPGQIVGKSGATGNVTGPHLHFEARHAGGHYGDCVNPINVKRKR